MGIALEISVACISHYRRDHQHTEIYEHRHEQTDCVRSISKNLTLTGTADDNISTPERTTHRDRREKSEGKEHDKIDIRGYPGKAVLQFK